MNFINYNLYLSNLMMFIFIYIPIIQLEFTPFIN